MRDASDRLNAGFGLLLDSGMPDSEQIFVVWSALGLGDAHLWLQVSRLFEMGTPFSNLHQA